MINLRNINNKCVSAEVAMMKIRGDMDQAIQDIIDACFITLGNNWRVDLQANFSPVSHIHGGKVIALTNNGLVLEHIGNGLRPNFIIEPARVNITCLMSVVVALTMTLSSWPQFREI